MATGDNDNGIDGNGATGNKVDNDGDGMTGDNKNDKCEYDVLSSKFVLLTWKGGRRPVDQ